MKIGNIDLGERPVLLAPMEDVTDASFRYICKQFGADMMYTEFISSDGLIRDAAKTIAKMQVTDDERPIGIQIYGHIPDAMVEAAVRAEEAHPDLIDINFGCPVNKIARRGAIGGVKQYLEPICRDVINDYENKSKEGKTYTITQNPGWEE